MWEKCTLVAASAFAVSPDSIVAIIPFLETTKPERYFFTRKESHFYTIVSHFLKVCLTSKAFYLIVKKLTSDSYKIVTCTAVHFPCFADIILLL
jgi:hypothetical protein